jgi:hypothetical protein
MKKLVFLFVVLISQVTLAQKLNIPEKFEPADADDYEKFEPEVIRCIDWLMSTPYNTSEELRKKANSFLLQWVSGSPSINIELREQVMTLVENNPDLLAIYLGGWTKYSLTSTHDFPVVEGHVKGMEAAVDFYEKNRESLKRDKGIEKLIKQKNKGVLESALRENWG